MNNQQIAINSMMNDVIGACVSILVSSIVDDLLYTESACLWISSPSGKTTKQLPFYQSLRIIRKHNWRLAEVEPIKPPITRRQAFKVLLFGNQESDKFD